MYIIISRTQSTSISEPIVMYFEYDTVVFIFMICVTYFINFFLHSQRVKYCNLLSIWWCYLQVIKREFYFEANFRLIIYESFVEISKLRIIQITCDCKKLVIYIYSIEINWELKTPKESIEQRPLSTLWSIRYCTTSPDLLKVFRYSIKIS